MKNLFLSFCLLTAQVCTAQNVGIGKTNPTERLDVNGTLKATNVIITGSGSRSDLLKKGGADSIVFSKGHNGLGLNYIIAIQGIYPAPDAGGYNEPFLGEIRLFAGNFPPKGFAFCQGQLLPINQNQALFSLLENRFGGNGTTTFALPDLRAAVPVGIGAKGPETPWALGERSQ
jgi:microcystin-dependent protein